MLPAAVRYRLGLGFFRPDEHVVARSAAKDLAVLKAHYLETERWWRSWTAKIRYRDGHGVSIMRSALTLKALCYAPTGAIVAAVTTSLPEATPRSCRFSMPWMTSAA